MNFVTRVYWTRGPSSGSPFSLRLLGVLFGRQRLRDAVRLLWVFSVYEPLQSAGLLNAFEFAVV